MSQDEAKRTQGCLRGFFLKYVVHLLIVIVAVQGLPFWKLSQGHQRFQGTSALELVLDTLGCSIAEAGEVSVFGPKKYIRTTGKPNIYTDRFSAQVGKGTVVVVNGEADGSHRVSSAIITLNGRNILKTKDFNQNVYRLRVVVDLAALNTLVVQLRSKPDSFLTIEILMETQNNPPVADAGPDQTVFVSQTVTLDGSASSDVDGDTLTYTWSLTSVPPGSTAALSDPAAMKPTFVPDFPGLYVAQLIVNDGTSDSFPDTANITATIWMTIVPDVAGLPQASAESAITAAHLAVGTIALANSATIPANYVISQDPPAGSSAAEGSSVNLVISLGFSVMQVGPEGGILHFPNGVILDIPPGAVNEMVNIEITDLSCEEVDAIILSQQLATHQKRCLRGFSAKPDGLVFNVPIMAIVSVSLEPGEIPVRIGVDVNNHVQWTINAGLVYRGNDGVIEMSLEHFSDEYLAAAARKNEREQQCKRCETYIPYKDGEVWCGPLDVPNPVSGGLQPGACQLLKAEREEQGCKVDGLKCCMEELIHVEVTDADFISGECQIVGGKLSVTFHTCDGSPTITDSMGDVGCPEGTILKLEILSDKPSIHACETANLKATLTATSPDGRVLLKGAAFPADFSITTKDPDVATLGDMIPPNGVVVEGGKEAGDVQIHASAIGAEDKIAADFTLTVISNIGLFSVSPFQETIKVGDSITLQANIVGADGNPLDASDVHWKSSDDATAYVFPFGDGAPVTGADCGQATITAEYNYKCETRQTEAMVTVEPRVNSCQVNPPASTLSVGESILLEAILLDSQGNPATNIDPNSVTWSSSSPDIASASPGIGLLTMVGANSVGEAKITTIYPSSNRCGGQISCLAQVRVNCELCTFQVTPPAQVLILGTGATTLTAELRDVRGNLVAILPPSTVTWTSNSSCVSLQPTMPSQTAVTPITEGTATITATYTDMFGQKTATAVITVTAPPKAWHNWSQIGKFENMKLGADGQGNVFAAWQERQLPEVYLSNNKWPNTFYKDIYIGHVGSGQITPITTCEGSSGVGTSMIAFFVDKMGNMIVAYETRTFIDTPPHWELKTWVKRYNVDRGWDDTPVLIAGRGYDEQSVVGTQIAADSYGNTIIVWNDSGTIGALRYDVSQGWQSLTPLAQAQPGSSVKIAMDPPGNAIVVWSTYNNVDASYALHTKKYSPDSGWDAISSRIASPTNLHTQSLDILMDSKGNAIVTWYNPDVGIRARHYDINAGWQPVINVADNPSDNFLQNYYISMDESGNAMVIYWEGPAGEEVLMSKGYSVDQGWDDNAIRVMSIEDVWRPLTQNPPEYQQRQGWLIIAFSMHGEGNATLINGSYVETLYGNKITEDFYVDARQYWAGEGWNAPAPNTMHQGFYRCSNPIGKIYGDCLDDGFEWLNAGTIIIDRYGNATAAMVRINGHWEGHWAITNFGDIWVFDRWVYDYSGAIVMQFE